MRRAWRWLLLLALVGCALPARDAWAARRRAEWTSVVVRPGEDAARVAKKLRGLLVEASRRADWGKGVTWKLSANVGELRWERSEDVLRLDVVVVGKIEGGPSARSRIRVGGRPAERSKLEREALQIVATGLVTRLAELSRAQRPPPKP